MKSTLAKSISRKAALRDLLLQAVALTSNDWWVEDELGQVVFGQKNDRAAESQTIIVHDEWLGTAKGTKQAEVAWAANMLQNWLKQEAEKKQLGSETLHLYREINLIFSFSEKLTAALGTTSIARLTLEEARQIIRFRSGTVFLLHENTRKITTLAHIADGIFDENEALPAPLPAAVKMIRQGKSEILAPAGEQSSMTLLAALRIGQRVLGGIALHDEGFKAADLKLLSALAVQTAAAVENSIQHEIATAQALKEQQEKLTLELALKKPFFKKVMAIIENRFVDHQFSVASLAEELHMSVSQLQRKIGAMTDLTPLQIIRDMRLRKAKELLRSTDKNVAEIAYEAGFNDPSYFTRIFSKEFGGTPSEWKEAQLKSSMQAIQENKIMKMYVDEGVLQFMGGKSEDELTSNETAEVTVVFIDICGFTAISEREAPDAVVRMLNQLFDLIVPSIINAGGKVDKFIGDAVLAVFQDDDHLYRAIQAAIAINTALKISDYADASLREAQPMVSIGLNTGEVVAGNVGSATLRRFDFTVIGDVVNTAQRLQTIAGPGQILLHEATFQKISDRVSCREVGVFSLKNKRGDTRVYEVLM